jgi:hypothetical protein
MISVKRILRLFKDFFWTVQVIQNHMGCESLIVTNMEESGLHLI